MNTLCFYSNLRLNLADKWDKCARVYMMSCLFASRPHHNPCFLFITSSAPLFNGYSHTNLLSDCNTHALALIVMCLVARTACRVGDTPTRHGSALMRCLTTSACDKAVTKCNSLSAVVRDEEGAFRPEIYLNKKFWEELIAYFPFSTY
jgi:hypothetical protein